MLIRDLVSCLKCQKHGKSKTSLKPVLGKMIQLASFVLLACLTLAQSAEINQTYGDFEGTYICYIYYILSIGTGTMLFQYDHRYVVCIWKQSISLGPVQSMLILWPDIG